MTIRGLDVTIHGLDAAQKTLDERVAQLESLTAWVNDPTPTDEVARQLAEIRQAILWVLKQPWEKDFASWEELVKAVTKDSPKALRFREEVVTPPPVRDVL